MDDGLSDLFKCGRVAKLQISRCSYVTNSTIDSHLINYQLLEALYHGKQ